jgi:predicted SAM-dependent methyltransferase
MIAYLKKYTWNHITRRRLKHKITQQLHKGEKVKIVLGSGGPREAGWIATDIDILNVLHLDDWQYYFRPGLIDALLAEHVWEHLMPEDGLIAARNCYRYLKPGGYFRVAVPDGFHPSEEYIEYVKPAGTGSGAEDHKILYNFRLLGEMFNQAGFKIDLLEYFDEKREFHYKEWSPQEGMIYRSKRFDERNQNSLLNYTSLILDAKKE